MKSQGFVYVIAGVVLALVVGIWVGTRDDRYRAQTVLAIGPAASIVDDADLIDVLGSIERSGMPATGAGIATSSTVRDRVVSGLDMAPGELGDYEIDSVPVPSANLLDIVVTGPDAERVAAVASSVAAEVQTEFQRIYRVYEISVLTDAAVPSESDRPNGFLLVLLAFVVGIGGAAAVDVAMATRRRRALYEDALG